MINPEYLVTHHGADSRLLTLAEMKRIYQETHYTSLYLKYNQPQSTSKDFPDIAYHVLIGSDGWCYMRDLDIHAYHASNYNINLNSIGICISGNYDTMKLPKKMEKFYREAVADLREEVPSLRYAQVHRTYANKTCPGTNITDDFVKEVFDTSSQSDYNRAMALLLHATEDLKKAKEIINK